MEFLMGMLDWMKGDAGTYMLLALLALSEMMASMDSLKSNSILQAVKNGLYFVADRLTPGLSDKTKKKK